MTKLRHLVSLVSEGGAGAGNRVFAGEGYYIERGLFIVCTFMYDPRVLDYFVTVI